MTAASGTDRSRVEAGARLGGKYRLLRRIAVGGMGEVWRARNEATGADVALKVVRRDADGTTAERLRSEARLSAMLSHRNIVRIFDLLEEPDGSLVLVMELLRGEALGHWLARRRTVPLNEALAIVVPVLSALAHAHDSGIVHRDVTPSNIFLTTDPDGHVTPKLVDFGIAKLPKATGAGSQTLPGSVLGTPRYMSPEQIRGAEELDGRSDLFSVAAVLYEMLTGSSPFDAPTPAASLALVLESSVDPDPLIDPRVWVEMSRALSKRPYGRHAGARELADALLASVSESEASLAPILKRDAPGREDVLLESGDESPQKGATSVEGQSLESVRRPLSRSAWLVGFACAAGVAIGVASRRPSSEVAAILAPPSAIPSSSTDDAAPPTASPVATSPPVAPADASSGPSERGPGPPPKPPSRPARPPVRPPAAPTAIATTPGF